MTDPYQILGVSPGASDDEVKKAYRNMCRKYHPDRNPGNQAAEDMFKIVQEAYDTIMEQRKNGSYSSYSGSSSGGFGYGGYNAGNQAAGQEAGYYQVATNYINSGSYREALNVLAQIKNRSAQWFYLSAIANSGIGNNYVAQEQARTAASMEPGNIYYSSLVNNLAGGAYRYSNMQQPYGSNMYSTGNFCMQLCAMNLCINACCDGDVCCC